MTHATHALSIRCSFVLVMVFSLSCSSAGDKRTTPPNDDKPASAGMDTKLDGIYVPASPQRPGDPDKGYRALLSEGYVGCGMPWSAVKDRMTGTPAGSKLPDRPANNRDMPYSMNRVTSVRGAEIATGNCLGCHAGEIEGKLIVGLGNIHSDFTRPPRMPPAAMGMMLKKSDRDEFNLWHTRFSSITPYIQMLTVGLNPADNITAALFAHRDPKTLAWSEEPVIPMPKKYVLPVDVPPWWHTAKKNALYYTAAGRGDHARLMMLASVVCVDTVEHARAIDSYFPDIRAYIASITPPAYTRAIDRQLAQQGQTVFEETCSECHGTYGDGGSYPNRVLPVDEIGTDPWLASDDSFYHGPFPKWLEQSFYGEISQLTPEKGYIAPPLDGIWSSAPYLHNGSVPTVRAVLDSESRPNYWRRSENYDYDNLGWKYEVTPPQGEVPEDQRGTIYDTGNKGYSNTGHEFGDDLSDDERNAVIEYLKTL